MIFDRTHYVMQRLRNDWTYKQIADDLGVSRNVVAGIVNRHLRGSSRNADEARIRVCELIDAGLNNAEINKRTRMPEDVIVDLRLELRGVS